MPNDHLTSTPSVPPAPVNYESSDNPSTNSIKPPPLKIGPLALTAVQQVSLWFCAAASVCAAAGWVLQSSSQPIFNSLAILFFAGSVGLLVALVVADRSRLSCTNLHLADLDLARRRLKCADGRGFLCS